MYKTLIAVAALPLLVSAALAAPVTYLGESYEDAHTGAQHGDFSLSSAAGTTISANFHLKTCFSEFPSFCEVDAEFQDLNAGWTYTPVASVGGLNLENPDEFFVGTAELFSVEFSIPATAATGEVFTNTLLYKERDFDGFGFTVFNREYAFDVTVTSDASAVVPLPASAALLGLGIFGLGAAGRLKSAA